MTSERQTTLKTNQIVAYNIRKFRQERKYSQEKLAEICGYHRTYIGAIERGERNITLKTLDTIAMALEASVADLLLSDTEKL